MKVSLVGSQGALGGPRGAGVPAGWSSLFLGAPEMELQGLSVSKIGGVKEVMIGGASTR